jgi:hypothetical protein
MDIFITLGEIEDGLADLVATCGTYSYSQTVSVDPDTEDTALIQFMLDELLIQDLLEGLNREML